MLKGHFKLGKIPSDVMAVANKTIKLHTFTQLLFELQSVNAILIWVGKQNTSQV